MYFNLKKFLLKLIGYSFILFVLFLIILQFIFKVNKSIEISLGYSISLFIFILGFVSINWSFNRSLKTFMGVILGGMFLRFVLIGIALFLLIQHTNIHTFSFVLSFLVFYIIYQFYEIRFINMRLSKGNKWLKFIKDAS